MDKNSNIKITYQGNVQKIAKNLYDELFQQSGIKMTFPQEIPQKEQLLGVSTIVITIIISAVGQVLGSIIYDIIKKVIEKNPFDGKIIIEIKWKQNSPGRPFLFLPGKTNWKKFLEIINNYIHKLVKEEKDIIDK